VTDPLSSGTDTNRSTDEQFAQPTAVQDVDIAFGGDIRKLMPAYQDIPEDFRRERDPFSKLVHKWFFEGLRKDAVTPKEGIDANAAWRHLRAIMGSFEPSHEHKTSGVAWLMSRWFEPPKGSKS
jgi:hypothetical protein